MDVKLRLVQFEVPGGSQERRVGVEVKEGGGVVDMCAMEPDIPRDMRSFLQHWDTALPLAAR